MNDFNYNEEYNKRLLNSVSKERLSTYINLSSSKKLEDALKLYTYNTKISESFYAPIQGLEVTLRNAIHRKLSESFGEDWLDSFPLQYSQKLKIKEASSKLQVINTPKVIAELNFGFWVSILGRHYESAWRKHLRAVFKTKNDTPLKRKTLHKMLDEIRLLRNRIAHHEPILQRNLKSDHQLILEIINMICPITSKWVAHYSNFEKIYKINYV